MINISISLHFKLPPPKPRVPEVVVYEDDLIEIGAYIEVDGNIEAASQKDDDGPTPKTPFKASDLFVGKYCSESVTVDPHIPRARELCSKCSCTLSISPLKMIQKTCGSTVTDFKTLNSSFHTVFHNCHFPSI